MENKYLEKYKEEDDFELIMKIEELVPEVFEVLRMMLVIETEEKLTPVRFKACRILYDLGMVNGQEFKEEIGLAQSTSSELLSRMISDGMVMKVMDKKDARCSVFLLTEEGEDLFQRVLSLRYQRLKVILSYLGKNDKSRLVNSLKNLVEVLRKFEE